MGFIEYPKMDGKNNGKKKTFLICPVRDYDPEKTKAISEDLKKPKWSDKLRCFLGFHKWKKTQIYPLFPAIKIDVCCLCGDYRFWR